MPTATFPANAQRNATSQVAPAPHRKNAAPVNPLNSERSDSSPDRNNPVQLVIKQAVDSLVQQLEAGKSDALTAYLAAMGRFHRYSFGNIMCIARQRAVTYCFTSPESMNIGRCASLETLDGRIVAVRTNLSGPTGSKTEYP